MRESVHRRTDPRRHASRPVDCGRPQGRAAAARGAAHLDGDAHPPLQARDRGFTVPEGEVYVAVESARGELGCYVCSDGGPRPWRVRFRAPSFVALQATATCMGHALVADMIAVVGSLDTVMGEVDRCGARRPDPGGRRLLSRPPIGDAARAPYGQGALAGCRRRLAEEWPTRSTTPVLPVGRVLLRHVPSRAHRQAEVEVCTNLSCALVGAQEVVRAFESELGISAGETTEDGQVTFRVVECLNGCGYAQSRSTIASGIGQAGGRPVDRRGFVRSVGLLRHRRARPYAARRLPGDRWLQEHRRRGR